MTRKTPLTPDQVRQKFRSAGITLTQWAKDNGFPRQAVYRVMAGQDKGHYGQSHAIAVGLGLKLPDHHAQPTTMVSGINPQNCAVA